MKQEQILEMHRQGHKIRAITKCLRVSRKTVRRCIREADAVVAPTPAPTGAWHERVDWEKIRFEWSKGVTITVLHRECAPEISYLRFLRYFRKIKPGQPQVSMRLNHSPGEKAQFDFTDGINIIDRVTGAVTTTELLCAVMPFSSLTWGEFIPSQKQPELMRSMEKAWHFFGGVTPYVTFDNLKSAVTRAHIYDPDVNKTFCDYANHWGFAVLPARPFKPRDKAANECGIGVIQRGFYNEVRERTFYSSDELNVAFREYLGRLNEAMMKDHGISRRERFKTEQSLLKPLPVARYEISEWRSAKVHSDCHIQVDKRFYSVPFAYVGRNVRVRLTEKLIEVFDEDRLEPLAVHGRLRGQQRVSTIDSHYPEQKVSIARFEVKHGKAEAEKIGPQTKALVDHLFDHEYPLKYLRRVQGILRLVKSGQVTREALEHASRQAMTFRKTNYEYVKSCAVYFNQHRGRPQLASLPPKREISEVHLHNNPYPKGGTKHDE